jgi:hypothetical protein
MPDTPIIIDGNNKKLTISLPPSGTDKREIVAEPNAKALSVRVRSDNDTPLVLALGNNGTIVIDEPDKLPK